MTAEWITPKTDWEDGDYYQHEDAERFLNNINYLRVLGSPMVPDDSSVLVPRQKNPLHFSVYNISFDYSKKITVDRSAGGSSISIASVSYDNMFNSIEFDNVHDIFKIGLEILFKLRLLYRYYIDQGRLYPMYLNDSDRYDIDWAIVGFYPSTTVSIVYLGWFLIPWYLPVPDQNQDLLDPVWGDVMSGIPRPFSISTSLEYINIQSRDLLANQPFFSADVLNRIENYMLEVYNKFNDLRQTYPHE